MKRVYWIGLLAAVRSLKVYLDLNYAKLPEELKPAAQGVRFGLDALYDVLVVYDQANPRGRGV